MFYPELGKFQLPFFMADIKLLQLLTHCRNFNNNNKNV